jgi:hypothetical protein
VIRGMKRQRLKTLLANDINLYGWHCRWMPTRSWGITRSWRICWGLP